MIMEQAEMKLHILLFLVPVIVTCQACYRPGVDPFFSGEEGYDYKAVWPVRGSHTGFPPISYSNDGFFRRPHLNGGPQGPDVNSRNHIGSYTKVFPENKRPLLASRYLHGVKGSEVGSSSSNQGAQGRFLGNFPPRHPNRVDGDRVSKVHDKSSVGHPGVRYSNKNKPDIDIRYLLYDGSQVLPPYDDFTNRMNSDSRSLSNDGSSDQSFSRYPNKVNRESVSHSGLVKRPSDWRQGRLEVNRERYDEHQPSRPYIDYATGEEFDKRDLAFERAVEEEYPNFDSIPIDDSTDGYSKLDKIGFQTRFGVDSPVESYYLLI